MLRTSVDTVSDTLTAGTVTANVASAGEIQSVRTGGRVRYVITAAGAHTLTGDEYGWGVIVNNAASGIVFPSVTTLKTVTGYTGGPSRVFVYRILNNQGATCTLTAGTGGTVPVAITIPANTFAYASIVLSVSSYDLYTTTSTGGGSGGYGVPQPLWPDLITPATLIPSPAFYLFRTPGTLSSQTVENAVICTIDDSGVTKRFLTVWYTSAYTGIQRVYGLVTTYNTTTTAYTFGSPIIIDSYASSIPANISGIGNFACTCTVIDSTHVMIAYIKDVSAVSTTVNVVRITVSGVTFTVGTPVQLANDVFLPDLSGGGSPTDASVASNFYPFGRALSGTLFVYGYLNTSSDVLMRLVDVSSGTPVVSSSVTVAAGATSFVDICVISGTVLGVAYVMGASVGVDYVTITTTPFAIVSTNFSSIAVYNQLVIDGSTLLNMDGTIFVLCLSGVDSPLFTVPPRRFLLTLAGNVFTLIQTYVPADARSLTLKTSATTMISMSRYNNLTTTSTPTIRTFAVTALAITQSSSISMNATPSSSIGNMYPMWFDTFDSGSRFYVVHGTAPAGSAPQLPTDLSTDVYMMSGSIAPLARMTSISATYLTPYGGGANVAIVPAATMPVELLPNTAYYSHTYTGTLSDIPYNDPRYVGDIANEVGTTGADRTLLTFV